MMFRYRLLGAPLSALLAISTALAQSEDDLDAMPEEVRAGAEAFVADLVTELELSDEQTAEVRAIYAGNKDQRAALMREMQALRDSGASRRDRFRQMRDLRTRMQRQQQETRAKLAEVLDDEQMDDFDAIIQARKDELRERVRQGRPG